MGWSLCSKSEWTLSRTWYGGPGKDGWHLESSGLILTCYFFVTRATAGLFFLFPVVNRVRGQNVSFDLL